MPLSVIITDIIVDKIDLNFENGTVNVSYSMVDATGIVWKQDHVIFWAQLPEGSLENWFALPQNYIDLFINLKNDADSAITNFVFGG